MTIHRRAHEKTPVLQGCAVDCDVLHIIRMGDTGPEHTINSTQKTAISKTGDAESDAVDARLQAVVDAWPDLPDDVKDEMVEMVSVA
jgi:hypothetical protein